MVSFQVGGYKVDFDFQKFFQQNVNYLFYILIASYCIRFAYFMVNKIHRERREEEERLRAALGDVQDQEDDYDGEKPEQKEVQEEKKDK